MATGVIEPLEALRRPIDRRPGIVDRLLLLVDALPGPAALSWAATGVLLALAGHLIVWSTGGRPFGQLLHDVVVPALVFAWFGWLTHKLNVVATHTFDEFRPALGEPDADERYVAQLTSIDDRMALVAAIVTVGVVSVGFYLGVRPTREPIPPEVEVVAAPLWGLTAAALGVVILHTISQLRLVSRLSAVARNVDIFKPAPINAFSKLTAVSAMGLIVFVVAFILFSPEQPLPYVLQEAALLAIAVLSFILPLRVMHNRLEHEKKRLIAECQDRLKAVLAEVHRAVDQNDLTRSEQLNHALTAVLAERDVLHKLHTWPWSTTTIRGFVSALVVPIALIMFTQVIDRLI